MENTKKPIFLGFKIIPISFFKDMEDSLVKIITGKQLKEYKDDEVTYSFSHQSGYLTFIDSKNLYCNDEKALIKLIQKSEAELFAKNIVINANNKFNTTIEPLLKKNQIIKDAKTCNYFPESKNLKLRNTIPFLNPETQKNDHWLVVFDIELEHNGEKIQVMDSSIEIRFRIKIINGLEKLELIAYIQRWRPIYKSFNLEKYLPDTPTNYNLKQSDELLGGSKICYILNDSNSKQYQLIPYEVKADGHEIDVFPASPYSITIDFAYEEGKLVALIQGVSDKIECNWVIFKTFSPKISIKDDGDYDIGNEDEIIVKPAILRLIPLPKKIFNLNVFKSDCSFEEVQGYEIICEVNDKAYNNYLTKHIALNVSEIQKKENKPQTHFS